MPPRRSQPDLLVDTSVAVALTVADHELHGLTVDALDGQVLGLAGHAAFETFSVLTRLPPPARRAPSVVAQLLGRNFPETRFLSVEGAAELLSGLAAGEISGGAVYDALVGGAAREHGLALATHDHRALDTYRVLGVEVVLLGSGAQPEQR
jgi:predicted nucleic acid-binding protein